MKKHVAIIQNGFGGPSILGWTDEARKLETGAYRVYVNEWQPIETAPKNGIPIDLWLTYPASEMDKAGAYREPDCEWRIDKDGRGPFWCRHSEDYETGGWTEIECTPTHWMPLPEPPEVK